MFVLLHQPSPLTFCDVSLHVGQRLGLPGACLGWGLAAGPRTQGAAQGPCACHTTSVLIKYDFGIVILEGKINNLYDLLDWHVATLEGPAPWPWRVGQGQWSLPDPPTAFLRPVLGLLWGGWDRKAQGPWLAMVRAGGTEVGPGAGAALVRSSPRLPPAAACPA